MTDSSEPVVPAEVKLCKHCGIRPAGHGRFGNFCDDPDCKAERLAEERDRQGRTEPNPPKRNRPTGNPGNLQRDIKEAMMGTAAVVAISNPGIFVAVEATVDEFAAAWANVARTSPTAERYIRGLLTGGVWITAFSATLTMVVAVMVTTGSTPPRLAPMGWYVAGQHPSIVQYVQMRQAQSAPAPAPAEEAEAA